MWTNENRCRCDRSHLRYQSDVTDEESREIEPLIPPAKPGGTSRVTSASTNASSKVYSGATLRPL